MPKPKYDPYTNEDAYTILKQISLGLNYCKPIADVMQKSEVAILQHLQKLVKINLLLKPKKNHTSNIKNMTLYQFEAELLANHMWNIAKDSKVFKISTKQKKEIISYVSERIQTEFDLLKNESQKDEKQLSPTSTIRQVFLRVCLKHAILTQVILSEKIDFEISSKLEKELRDFVKAYLDGDAMKFNDDTYFNLIIDVTNHLDVIYRNLPIKLLESP